MARLVFKIKYFSQIFSISLWWWLEIILREASKSSSPLEYCIPCKLHCNIFSPICCGLLLLRKAILNFTPTGSQSWKSQELMIIEFNANLKTVLKHKGWFFGTSKCGKSHNLYMLVSGGDENYIVSVTYCCFYKGVIFSTGLFVVSFCSYAFWVQSSTVFWAFWSHIRHMSARVIALFQIKRDSQLQITITSPVIKKVITWPQRKSLFLKVPLTWNQVPGRLCQSNKRVE